MEKSIKINIEQAKELYKSNNAVLIRNFILKNM